MSVAENIARVRAGLPAGVELVAVSKTHPAERVMEAYEAGQRVFGENRPQEMAAKRALLPADVRWHMIGHLQTNKVRLVAPFVEMIHSVDSARLAAEISRRAVEAGRTIDALLEIHIAREQGKHGWEWSELVAWLETDEWRRLPGLRLRGVMGVATFTDDVAVVSAEFCRLAAMHRELGERFFGGGVETDGDSETTTAPAAFDTLSMGMSDDYPLAVTAGSTMVRVGSTIFGRRDYAAKQG
ncbi:MAG: YggS family pyridoxal phosphate-dependent enzyme [Alistipes sp.]|jgi:pyridoxal phosphate enzyme (YggS family)|nr:YggS family pyridoxal phosphate-dependent enzyme [Alistipes sp.]